jgi:hypothetical protein
MTNIVNAAPAVLSSAVWRSCACWQPERVQQRTFITGADIPLLDAPQIAGNGCNWRIADVLTSCLRLAGSGRSAAGRPAASADVYPTLRA